MNYEVLEKKYGTPLYIFDCDKIKERIKSMKTIFKNIEICYAIKANSFVVKEIINDVDRLEICSNGEYEICKSLNIDDNKIVLSGVNKSLEDFENIIKENKKILRFTIESINQFEMLKKLTEKYQTNINILPRITSGNQFGITKEELEFIIKNKNNFMNVVGIEYFSGTQKHSMKRIIKEFEKIKSNIDEVEEKYNICLEEIEYGTGFPVYYFIDETFDENEFFVEFNKNINEFFKGKKIILEIGRSLVASSGVYLTKIVDLKENKTGKYAILDGGINHLVYYGGTMGMRIPHYEILNKENIGEDIINLYGSLCTINDVLVKNLQVPTLDINDVFIFKNVGAYSVTEGISLFLSRDLPKVLLISNNEEILVRDSLNTYKLNCPMYKGE